jgi:hypothetical protein
MVLVLALSSCLKAIFSRGLGSSGGGGSRGGKYAAKNQDRHYKDVRRKAQKEGKQYKQSQFEMFG